MDIYDSGYRKQKGVECEYKGVLGKVFVVGIMAGGEPVRGMVEAAMQADSEGLGWEEGDEGSIFEGYVRWGCKKRQWGGIEGNNMSWIIWRIVAAIEA